MRQLKNYRKGADPMVSPLFLCNLTKKYALSTLTTDKIRAMYL